MADEAAAAAPAAPAGAQASQANPTNAPSAAAPSPGTTGQPQGKGGSAQPVANQPTKTELKELGEDNMDAMVTVKVNGQTKKMTVRDALKQAELAEGAQYKMQQVAKERKEAERLIKLAKSDPDKFLAETGLDPDQYAENRLVKKYERLAMSPEQRQALETAEKLKQYEARDNQTREGVINQIKNYVGDLPPEYIEALKGATPEQLQGQLQRAQSVYRDQQQALEKEFIDAWQETGLPRDTIFGTWVASLMHASQVQKNSGSREQALQAKEAAAIVKENFLSAVSRITDNMDAEAIHRLLGPETMKKLREFDVQRVTKSAPSFERQDSPARKPASSKNSKHVNEQGWKAAFGKIS